MSARVWPSREEWQAKAEYAVRTACTMYERLDRLQPDTRWSSLAEDQELEELAFKAAGALRPLLTEQINELRLLLPDRPKAGRQRAKWFVSLSDEAYETAVNLGALEQIRTALHRARTSRNWAEIAWQLHRINESYAALELPADLVEADARMQAILDQVNARRREAALAIEQAAVEKEIARRATDEAWAKERERRAAIDHPRVIRVGHAPPSEGDQVT